jgi:hypothetical protein
VTVVDPGHLYLLDHLDGGEQSVLQFVKREGPGYPGNVGHHEGTTVQEVCRALIARLKYVDQQEQHPANTASIGYLRSVIYQLEVRAAKRHRAKLRLSGDIELQPVNSHGHLYEESEPGFPTS